MAVVRAPVTIGEFEIATISNGTFKENCYVVSHVASGDCLVIDPGSEEAFLAQHLAARGLTPQKIVLTHGHFDHLGAVDALMKRYGIACEVHARDERLVRQAATYAFRFERGAALRVPRGLTYFTDDVQPALERAPDRRAADAGTHGRQRRAGARRARSCSPATRCSVNTSGRRRTRRAIRRRSSRRSACCSIRSADDCVVFPGHGKPWTIGEARAWWADVHGAAPTFAIHVPQAAGTMQTKHPRSRS